MSNSSFPVLLSPPVKHIVGVSEIRNTSTAPRYKVQWVNTWVRNKWMAILWWELNLLPFASNYFKNLPSCGNEIGFMDKRCRRGYINFITDMWTRCASNRYSFLTMPRVTFQPLQAGQSGDEYHASVILNVPLWRWDYSCEIYDLVHWLNNKDDWTYWKLQKKLDPILVIALHIH